MNSFAWIVFQKFGKCVVVFPNGEVGYWSNSLDGKRNYADYVFEVLKDVQSRYRISSLPSQRVIAGLSMGGFGALSIGLQNPQTFGIIAVLSPTDMELAVRDKPSFRVYQSVFGTPPTAGYVAALNPRELILRGAGEGQDIIMVFGTAEQKKFSDGAERLIRVARAQGLDIKTCVVADGKHDFKTTWNAKSMRWIFTSVEQSLRSK